MLLEKQQIGEKFSLVNQGKAEPLHNNTYQELLYRRVIPFSENVNDFEKWKGDIELQDKGAIVISKEHEKLHGVNNLLPISFLKKGNERSDAVCRIVTPTGYGTGFLVTGGLIMTNNHVIESIETASVSYAEFFYEEGRDPIIVHFSSDQLFITNELLDYTIVACKIDAISEVIPIELSPDSSIISDHERVSIIQHPRGRRKEIALQDNEVIYVYDKVVHYRTDTEVGASGSPVFNKKWELVALHHAGWYNDEKKTIATNEGILISAIVMHFQKVAFSNSPYRESARKVLNGIEKTSPILGFFDVNGLVDYDDESELEIEIPSHRGDRQFADIGFWNIQHFNDNVTNNRVSKVADVIANLSLDVFGLVEVEEKAIIKLIEALRKKGISLKYEYLNALGSQDLAVLYDEITTEVKNREDILKKHKRLLSKKTSKGKSAFPRKRHPLFVECCVKENDKVTKFLMIVVHLKAFGDSISKSRRKLASEILAVIIDDIRRNENIPIILGGDFNQKLDNSGVLNSLTKAPDLFTLTVDDSRDNAITYVGDHHKSLIDHIIVSDDIILGEISNDDAAIVRLDKGIAGFTKDISDHVPVVCRIIYNMKKERVTPTNHLSNNLDDDYQIGLLTASNNIDLDKDSYYNEVKDKLASKEYYGDIFETDITTSEFFFDLRDLVNDTHVNRYSYRTARLKYLYPIVDIRENGKLKSIYKQADDYYEVDEVLKKDYEIEKELMKRGTEFSENEWEVLEAYQPFNCEHVVCQSWFNRKEPMKSDLHHLFTCESGCNSSRGNKNYFDFPHYEPDVNETLRKECGYGEDKRFEPEDGKGAVARATLYFLIRYPKVISNYKPEDLETLLKWHKKYKVSIYEKHRNFEIHKIQGNRNPFIDYPDICATLDLEEGLR